MNDVLIIRMLGNDLKSLHGENQTYNNLDFTLKYEPKFKNTDKVFVLNRIYNQEKKNKLIELLNEYNIKFIDIPFEIDEYNKIKNKYDIDNLLLKYFRSINNNTKALIMYYYNLYLINNNACRNFCINYGKKNGYKWIFLLDSNNFLTQKAYNNIFENIDDETEYIALPSKRLDDSELTNDIILNYNYESIIDNLPIQEPQLFFKNTSKYLFNENIPYGSAPKAELLNALNVKGFWNKWSAFNIFSIKQRNFDNVNFKKISYIIRLTSGNKNNKRYNNKKNRLIGLFLLIKEINLLQNYLYIDNLFYKSCNKKFTFIITSYNMDKFIMKNLESVKTQIYDKNNYRIIYVNDCSNDNSKQILEEFSKNNVDINFELINNEQNMGPTYSRYIAYNKCDDDEICVFLDGDDWLIEENTLSILSYIYENNDIYATFGSMKNENWQYKKWKNYIRSYQNYFPHLRSCYSFLCKKIPENYLKYENTEWFKFNSDVALFMSICELCDNKYIFIKKELIEYNRYNSINNIDTGFDCVNKTDEHIIKRKNYSKYIRQLKPLNKIVD